MELEWLPYLSQFWLIKKQYHPGKRTEFRYNPFFFHFLSLCITINNCHFVIPEICLKPMMRSVLLDRRQWWSHLALLFKVILSSVSLCLIRFTSLSLPLQSLLLLFFVNRSQDEIHTIFCWCCKKVSGYLIAFVTV